MIKVPCTPQMGADIEGFVRDSKTSTFVPCVGLVKGTKEAPWTPEGYDKGFALQEDNVMLEFNVPPAMDSYAGTEYIRTAKRMAAQAVRELGYTVWWKQPSAEFLPEQLMSPQAKMIGCEADYDAYTGGKARNNTPVLDNFRSLAGHIHLGGDFNCPDFVAALFAELFLSVQGQGIVHNRNDRNLRVNWYGQPGIFRSKPYGIEYRTPTPMWIQSGHTAEWTYSRGLQCATWLTTTDSMVIQRAYRNIPWTKQRDYMLGGNEQLGLEVLNAAAEFGVDVS